MWKVICVCVFYGSRKSPPFVKVLSPTKFMGFTWLFQKRESKKPKKETPDVNVTIPAPDTESIASRDSFSMPASPMSTVSRLCVCSVPQLSRFRTDLESGWSLKISKSISRSLKIWIVVLLTVIVPLSCSAVSGTNLWKVGLPDLPLLSM